MAHITIPAVDPWRSYVAASGQTQFPVPFPFFDTADILVYVSGVQLHAGFTVTGTQVEGGFQSGTVTLATAPAEGAVVLVERFVRPSREVDFPYPSRILDIRSLNTALDRFTAAFQDIGGRLRRAVSVPPGEVGVTVPNVAQRAGRALGFDLAGAPVALPIFTGTAPPGSASPVQFGLSETASAVVNTAAILAALTVSRNVYIPPGRFEVFRGQILVASGQALRGAGRYLTVLVAVGGEGATVGFRAFSTGPVLTDLSLDATDTPGPLDRGFDASPSVSQATLERVSFARNWDGAVFANTDLSTCRDLIAEHNVRRGFWARPQASTLALQWYFVGTNLSQFNGADGYVWENNEMGPAALPMGTMAGIYSFANGGRSFKALGIPGHGLYGFRLSDHFIGADQGGLYMDTYGNHHQVCSGFSELQENGPGYEVTANNYGVRFTDCGTQQCAHEGMVSYAHATDFLNCHNFSNGTAGIPAKAIGVALRGQGSSAVGGRSGNLPGSSIQGVGVQVAAENCTVATINLNDNSVAPMDIVSGGGTVLMAAVHPHQGLVQRLGRLQSNTISPGEFEAGAANSGGSGKRAVVVPN